MLWHSGMSPGREFEIGWQIIQTATKY